MKTSMQTLMQIPAQFVTKIKPTLYYYHASTGTDKL